MTQIKGTTSRDQGPRSGRWSCLKQAGGCPCPYHQERMGSRVRSPSRITGWTDSEKQLLKQWITEGVEVADMGERFKELAARYPDKIHVRSLHAIRSMLRAQGFSTRNGWWTQRELADAFGVSSDVVAGWRRMGHVTAHAHGIWWKFYMPDVLKFARNWAGILFDPDRVQDSDCRHVAHHGVLERKGKVS